MQTRRDKLLAADLFAGAGGLSCGFLQAGNCEVVFANDIDSSAALTYQRNHGGVRFYSGPIEDLSGDRIKRDTGLRKYDLDVLLGGPPCQGFSIYAPKRETQDPRNRLFLEYARIVEELAPRFLLMENVPGLLSLDGGGVVDKVYRAFSGLGYNLHHRVLYAPAYGVPQERWRLIFIGARKGEPLPDFPRPTHRAPARANFTGGREWVRLLEGQMSRGMQQVACLEDAIGDLPSLAVGEGEEEMAYPRAADKLTRYQAQMRDGSPCLFNHVAPRLSSQNLERLRFIEPGGSWRDIPFRLLPAGMKKARRSDHTKRYGRLSPSALACTILTKCDPHWGSFYHYRDDRAITVREAARIQSFPDRFRFLGPRVEQYRQVGNAVPPLLAKELAESVYATAVYGVEASALVV